jgi:hypothetical protein
VRCLHRLEQDLVLQGLLSGHALELSDPLLQCANFCVGNDLIGNPEVDTSSVTDLPPPTRPWLHQFFIFRGRRSDRVKIFWRDADGLCPFCKRLDRGKFTWTHASDGAVLLTPAQLSALLEGIDWRRVHRTVSTEEPATPSVVA